MLCVHPRKYLGFEGMGFAAVALRTLSDFVVLRILISLKHSFAARISLDPSFERNLGKVVAWIG